MDIKLVAKITLAILLTFAGMETASAHLPYLKEGATSISVSKPETAQIYYGWLEGEPVVYTINSPEPFKLYVNLLSPQMSDARVDFSADIYHDGEFLDNLDGIDFVWLAFYDPFANDYFIRGPEYEKDVPAGKYDIYLYNTANYGDYALSIGQAEDRSVEQFLRTIRVLPQIKEKYFGRNSWEAYNSQAGMIALGSLVMIFILLLAAGIILRRRRIKSRLDNEDNEYKNNRQSRGKNYVDLSEVQRLFGR